LLRAFYKKEKVSYYKPLLGVVVRATFIRHSRQSIVMMFVFVLALFRAEQVILLPEDDVPTNHVERSLALSTLSKHGIAPLR
jgi:hypothetical protein